MWYLQAKTYKDDFEDERRDREKAHERSECLRQEVETIQTELNDAKAKMKFYEKQVRNCADIHMNMLCCMCVVCVCLLVVTKRQTCMKYHLSIWLQVYL